MKKFFVLILLSTVIASLSGQDKDTISTTLHNVVLYNQGATLTRVGTLHLKKGTTTIVVSKLPLDIDESSLGIKMSSGAMLLSQRLVRNYVDLSMIKSRYEEEKRILSDSIDWVNAGIEVLQGQETLLNSNRSLGNKESSFTTAELMDLNKYYGEMMQSIKEDILKHKISLRGLQKRIQQINAQMNEEGIYERRGESLIVLEIEASAARDISVEIEYYMDNAGWVPKYDLRMESLKDDLKLVYKAAVYQNTGEDWQKVALTLSTAKPRSDHNIPDLQPYYLDFIDYQQRMRPLGAGSDQALEEAVVAYTKSASPSKDMMTTAVGLEVVKNQTSISYNIEPLYDLPSSGIEQTVVFKMDEIPAQYAYVSVPKITETAYLTARIKEWESLNLLYGEANIFIENRFAGKTYIGDNQYEDEYVISLGKDDMVSVKREMKKDFSKQKFIGNNTAETRVWGITVKNNKDIPISMTVYDQYPVSQNGDIKVDLKEDGGAEKNEEKGMLTWKMNIAPATMWQRSFQYEVKYPKGRIINFD